MYYGKLVFVLSVVKLPMLDYYYFKNYKKYYHFRTKF